MRQFIGQRVEVMRAYYDGIGKPAIIYPAALTVALALHQVILGLVFFTRDVHGASPACIGWLAGSWSMSYVIGCMLVRPLFRNFLPRHLMVASNLVMCVLVGGLPLVPSTPWLFVVYIVLGVVTSLFWPPIMAWLSSGSEGAELGRLMGRFNIAWCFGLVVGPYLCGALYTFSPRLPFAVASGMHLLVAAFVAGAGIALPSIRRGEIVEAENAVEQTDASTPLRFPAWVGLFGGYFGMAIVGATFPLGGREELDFSEPVIGLLFLVRGLATGVTFAVMGRMVRWHFRATPMLVLQVIGALACLVMVIATTPFGFALTFAMMGVATGGCYMFSLFHGASGSANRARRMAIHESVLATGLFIGPGVGGVIYQGHGMRGVYWTAVAVISVIAIAQGLMCLGRLGRHD